MGSSAMHITDIEDALAHDDDRTIEAAFRALVTFPRGEPIEGAKNVDTLCRLLARVTRALQHNQGAMPSAIGGIISTVLDDPVGGTATYASGATRVSDHLYRWRGRYLQHAANGGAIG